MDPIGIIGTSGKHTKPHNGRFTAFCFSKAWSQICVELQTYRLNGYGELGKHNMLYMLKFIKKSKGMGEKDVI